MGGVVKSMLLIFDDNKMFLLKYILNAKSLRHKDAKMFFSSRLCDFVSLRLV